MMVRTLSDAMSDHDHDHDDGDIHACDCGATFDTLDALKDHAKENHPDAYEENFGDEE